MTLLVDTATVPPAERFEFWSEGASHALHPMGLRHLAQQPFSGRLRHYRLGPLELFRIEGDASAVSRTHASIARSDPEQLQFPLLRRGHFLVSQGGRATSISTGDLSSYDTSRPYDVQADRRFDLLLFSFPKAVLGPRADRMCRRTALALPSRHGVGIVATSFLSRLAAGLGDGTVRAGDLDLAQAALDVIRALHAGAEPAAAAPPAASAAVLVPRIKAYIEAHLGDPDLVPGRIAAAHHISTRYLHRLFEAEGTSVGRWTRERRLERCHRDLRDPALASTTAADIAARWGLTNPAHFSRLFRDAYGCSPREARFRPSSVAVSSQTRVEPSPSRP